MATKLTYEQYKEAYKAARHQYCCHRDMISGCWSISGKEFCEQYHLDYERARQYEHEQLQSDFDDLYNEEYAKIRRKIGRLTDNQEHWLIDYLDESFDWEEEQVCFWYDLAMNQLAQTYPEFDEKYYKDKDYK